VGVTGAISLDSGWSLLDARRVVFRDRSVPFPLSNLYLTLRSNGFVGNYKHIAWLTPRSFGE
jgi:hypothetical protein